MNLILVPFFVTFFFNVFTINKGFLSLKIIFPQS